MANKDCLFCGGSGTRNNGYYDFPCLCSRASDINIPSLYPLAYYTNLEQALIEFVNKYGYGVKSDREDYSTMVACSDIHKLKMLLKENEK